MADRDALTSEQLFVALDTTHALINRTGLGRYAAELQPALGARPDVNVLPIRAVRRVAASRAGRIAQGLRRETLYYPEGFARAARRVGAQLVHLPTPAPVRAAGMPLVVTVLDLLPLRHPELFTRQTRAHTRLYVPFVRRATRLIVPSHYTRAEAIELLRVPPDRVVVIPIGRAPRFSPRAVDRDALEAELGVGERYVLTVGTLEPRKNLVTVLRAFRRVADAVPDVDLVITGGRGWRNDAFESELGGAGAARRVRLTGFVSDERLVDLYAGAACFVFPSLAEGFGLPPLEAMACGAPVIVSDRTALPEVVGDAALLVDPRDPAALAAQIVRVLDDSQLATGLREAGLERAHGFTWAATAAATENVYREALAAI
jgi:glycosyltransferase involved in cell wall biosynthesis